MLSRHPSFIGSALVLLLLALPSASYAAPGDVIFVTQPPLPADFATINSVFANHGASMDVAPRGGDLYIRYADGTLKNLTKAAGLGDEGMQTSKGIAVRDPVVHWDGAKVLFSMVVGAPTKQYEVKSYRWQLYEITGLGKSQTPTVTKVPNQPSEYNNVMGAYASDDTIIFATDRPRSGEAHLYPQLDEYESTPTNSGLWSLNPATGALKILDHAPSGDFHPIVDSFGRVIFSRWDHLQRDQQKDAGSYGTFDYSSEAVGSVATESEVEVFPEARSAQDPDKKSYEQLHTINQFFPWMMLQDGTELETLNHVGRQELSSYGGESRNDDPNLTYISSGGVRTDADLFLHISEDPGTPGRFYGIRAPEFGTHAAGQIISMDGAPSINPADMAVVYVTHPDTATPSNSPSSNHSGLYRTPVLLQSKELIATHTSATREDANIGTSAQPQSRYAFRLVSVTKQGEYFKAGATLTNGIRKSISYWQPDFLVQYVDQEMWELQPVEWIARTRPPAPTHQLPQIEKGVFESAGVDLAQLKQFLKDRELALLIVRDVTSRDAADRQQPFNLKVSGSEKKRVGGSGKVYELASMQVMQGDLLRGIGGSDSPRAGRRVLARPVHDLPVENPGSLELVQGAVQVSSDGSVAAFVPANRALSWQLLSPSHEPVVRERYWVTFQPGEVRVCGGCHGANRFDQSGAEPPSNPPEALRELLSTFNGAPPLAEAPRFTLAVHKNGRKVSKLKRGVAFQVRLTPENAAAQGKSVTIEASDGKCKVSRQVQAPTTGYATIDGLLPSRKLKGILSLSARTNNESVSSLSITLVGVKDASRKSSSCSKLLKR